MSHERIDNFMRMTHALNPGPVPHHCAVKKHYLNHQTWTSQLISQHRAREQCTQLLSGTVKPLVYSVTGPSSFFFSLYFPVLSCASRKAYFWVTWAGRSIKVQIDTIKSIHFTSTQTFVLASPARFLQISNKCDLKLYTSKNKQLT